MAGLRTVNIMNTRWSYEQPAQAMVMGMALSLLRSHLPRDSIDVAAVVLHGMRGPAPDFQQRFPHPCALAPIPAITLATLVLAATQAPVRTSRRAVSGAETGYRTPFQDQLG